MTRKRRYLISAAVLAACVCLALGVLALLPPRPGVTKANFDRIENGMTQEEVESIFGEARPSQIGGIWIWPRDDGAEFYIAFDGQNSVIDKRFFPSHETLSEKLRRWLHLPK